ncbi:hypothetical protein LguiB_029093 [Lonicera macranthoides]
MTSSLTATWSPNSFQLRLSFNCRKSAAAVFVQMRVRKKLYCKIRMFSATADRKGKGNGAERRRTVNSWMMDSNSFSGVDSFSGWSGNNGSSEQLSEPQEKGWLGHNRGLVGAGVAGVILFAGLTFATLSISKRTSRLKPQVKPLTTQQETLLDHAANDDLNDGVEEEGNAGSNAMLGNSSVVSKTGTENTDTTIENEPNLQNESVSEEIQVAPIGTPKMLESNIPGPSSFEDLDRSLVAEKLELSTEPKESHFIAKITNSSLSDNNETNLNTNHYEVVLDSNKAEKSNFSLDSSASSIAHISTDPLDFKISINSQFDAVLESPIANKEDIETVNSLSTNEDLNQNKQPEISAEGDKSFGEVRNLNGAGSARTAVVPESSYPFANEQSENGYSDIYGSGTFLDANNPGKFSSSVCIPAPSAVFPALQDFNGKVLVPAIVDQVQGQALSALQVLKVIEADVQPGDLCTRREYARWLVSASSAVSRNSVSKVYPAMYIENVTELAFNDITPDDPDFPSIQGLAEAGLISSKLSRRDMSSSLDEDVSSYCFCPESPLSRQDLVSWKMSLEKRQLPVADRKILQEVSGFLDTEKINPDACPALVSDILAGEQGIIAVAFGYTRLFQPDKPVTKAQAAIALATGEASDIVSEELARIEAESMAEKAVAAHSALVDEVEKDINASFEKDLSIEREKIIAMEKLAENARQELEKLRAEREEENIALRKERGAVDLEMEVLSKLRLEVEEQLQSLMSNKVELSYEKERLGKLQNDAEFENQEIARLQSELEVERKALSMARAWAEDEAKRAREQAQSLEEARDRWERHGIKVVVDKDLTEEANAGDTWLSAGKQFSGKGTMGRAENLVDKLKAMGATVSGKSRETIDRVIQKILLLISILKEWALKMGSQAGELKNDTVSKVGNSLQGLKQSSADFSVAVKDGVDKLTQKFKT